MQDRDLQGLGVGQGRPGKPGHDNGATCFFWMAASKGGHDDGIGGNIRSSRIPERRSLIRDRTRIEAPTFCDPASRFAWPVRQPVGRMSEVRRVECRLLGSSAAPAGREQRSLKLGISRLRFLHVRRFHVAETADHVRHARISRRQRKVRGREHQREASPCAPRSPRSRRARPFSLPCARRRRRACRAGACPSPGFSSP